MWYVTKRVLSGGSHEVYQARSPRFNGDKCLGLLGDFTDAVYQARKTYNLVSSK